MAEKPEDLSLPASVVARIIKDAVSTMTHPPAAAVSSQSTSVLTAI